MPVLSDPRYELVAQGLAKGLTQEQAYIEAGFRSAPGESAQANASRLIGSDKQIAERVAELQQEWAEAAGYNRVIATKYALEDRRDAREAKQYPAAVSANMLASKLNGLIIDKSLNINADLEDISVDALESLRQLVGGQHAAPMLDVTPSTTTGGMPEDKG